MIARIPRTIYKLANKNKHFVLDFKNVQYLHSTLSTPLINIQSLPEEKAKIDFFNSKFSFSDDTHFQ